MTDAHDGSAPTTAADPCVVDDTWVGLLPALALQVRRRTPSGRAWTSTSEQKILRVSNNRGACCHVAGDIDFDKHNNLWLVTGDDTPAGGGNVGRLLARTTTMKTDETADRARQQRDGRHASR